MSAEVLAPLHISPVMASLGTMGSASPKAVVSEVSPLKKRRVDDVFSMDYVHRKGSRSGDLALLRVLSAPTTGSSGLHTSVVRRQKDLIHFKSRPQLSVARGRSRSRSPKKTQPSLKVQTPESYARTLAQLLTLPLSQKTSNKASSSVMARSLDAKDFARPKLNQPTSSQAASKATSPLPTVTHLQHSSNHVLARAEELAGPTAIHSKTFLPPSSSDDMFAFLDPESAITSDNNAAMARTLRQKVAALAPGNNLLLIYPTQKGAETFVNKVLSPILDPLLRRAVNDHGLKPTAAAKLRNMEAVDSMLDAADLSEVVGEVVRSASKPNPGAARAHTTAGSFVVRFEAHTKADVPVAAWKNAWIEQERARVRDLVAEGLVENGGGATVDVAGIRVPKSAVRVAEELLDDLKHHTFADWEEKGKHGAAIEVAVFVIERR